MYSLVSTSTDSCSYLLNSVSNSYNRCGFLWGREEAFLLPSGKMVKDFISGKEKVYWVSFLEQPSLILLLYNSVICGKLIMQMILVHRNANELCLVECNFFLDSFYIYPCIHLHISQCLALRNFL